MFNPCFECYNRYNRQYTKECDTTCEYAKTCLENKELKYHALTCVEELELTKAIMGRGVDYKTTQQIVSDFKERMHAVNKIVSRGKNI